MQAKSLKGRSPEEIKNALSQSISDGFTPTLAIVFLSIKQNLEKVCNILDEHKIAIYGTTTNGEFIDEEIEEGSIAILLLDINTAYFFIQVAELNGVDDRKITSGLCVDALKRFDHPAFIIAGSNLQTDAEELLLGFTDAAGNDINVFGCMAGDDTTFTEQFVFTNKKSSKRGIVCLVLDEDKVMIRGRSTSGWKAVGTEKTITKSEGRRIYTIDNIPALDICLKFSGLSIDDPNLPIELVINFPLQLQRENGNPVMRPTFMINWDDHSLMASGKVPQGSKVRFSLPPDFDVIDKVINECEKLKETEMPNADALIIYNCSGRHLSLGPLISKEIEGIDKVWNVPIAGMFSNAELGRATNGNLEMHNLTTCCVALKEK
jgi:hypothetical protein